MKTALFSALLLLPSFAVQSDTSGTVALSSDYFWRGISQNAGNPALSLGYEIKDNGFYAGIWGSQVDYGDETSIEYDLYAGYALAITDDLSVTGGMIQYNWDTNLDILVDGHGQNTHEQYEEVFAKARYKTMSVAYYVETNDSDKHYFEASYGLPFITVVDVKVGYAEWYYGDKHASVTVSKDLGDYNLGIMVMDGARHGDPIDLAAVTVAYNF
jgi:uncharacterized protein (TIGR02001 family)